MGSMSVQLFIFAVAVAAAAVSQPAPNSLASAPHLAEVLGFDYSLDWSKSLRANATGREMALQQLRDLGAIHAKIFNADRDTISLMSQIWGDRPLQLMIAVCNPELPALAEGQESFQPDKLEYLLDTLDTFRHRIEFVAVGNEVEYPAHNNRDFAPLLMPVLHAIRRGLLRRGLGHVRLTSPFSDAMMPVTMAVTGPSVVEALPDTYDSNQGCNDAWCMDHHPVNIARYLEPLLHFLNETGGAWTMSVYPFFKWRDMVVDVWCKRYGPCLDVPLSFAVGAPEAPPVLDNGTGLEYTSLLEVMLDSVRQSLDRRGFTDVSIVVGETGWPTGGLDHPGVGAVPACHYVNSLVRLLHRGTPAGRGRSFRAYLFQWVDEEGKWDLFGRPNDPGMVEDHWGLETTSLTMKYAVDFQRGDASVCGPLPKVPASVSAQRVEATRLEATSGKHSVSPAQQPSPALQAVSAGLAAAASVVVAAALAIRRARQPCEADTYEPLLAA